MNLAWWQVVWIGFFVFLWIVVIVASGNGWNPFSADWDFSNVGSFGDSFGPLSALMALIAAVGAIAAYRVQSEEITRIRAREAEQDKILQSDRARAISRQESLDRQSEMQVFESTFFQLLKTHRDLVTGLDLVSSEGEKKAEGHDVFRTMLIEFKQKLDGDNRVQNVKEIWGHFSNHFKNDINHYFRLLYHIVRFIDGSQQPNKYFYIQILRASLSDAEISLLALNCDYGEGREKFKGLVEKYALLHNLSEKEIKYWKLRKKYESGAFSSDENTGDFQFYEN